MLPAKTLLSCPAVRSITGKVPVRQGEGEELRNRELQLSASYLLCVFPILASLFFLFQEMCLNLLKFNAKFN